jgi:cytochrome P450
MTSIKRPPGPKGLPVIGNLLDYAKDPVAFYMKNGRKYGDIVYYEAGDYKVYQLGHPDQIKDVLVTHGRNFLKDPWTGWLKPLLGEGLLTSEGEFHLRQRRLMQPIFHRQRIAQYGQVMAETAERTGERWRDGTRVDMFEEMSGLTLAVVAKTLFSSDVEDETEEIGEALTAFLEWWFFASMPLGQYFTKLPLPINRRYEKSKERLDATIYRLIREHRAGQGDKSDLLSMLLQAQDTEGDGGRMTDRQVRDEAITIFLAAHETTANALTWTWFLLSKHPRVEARLHAELDEVLGGRAPTVEDIPKLKYTEMVISEAMRLFPPAWVIGRVAIDDFQAGEYTVPAGSIVTTSQFVVHRDPRWYPNPAKFDPMRWTPEEKAKRPKYAYFPFGGGNRLCIGEPFAWMEAVLVLAALAQRWEARMVPEHKVGLLHRVTLRPKGGMPMVLQRRNAGVGSEVEREKVAVA